MPAPPPKHAYRSIRGKVEAVELQIVPTLLHVGAAFVYKDPRFGSYCVCDDSGLALTAKNFRLLRDAKAFVRGIGPRLGLYFERAAKGDRFAATAIVRLSRLHASRAERHPR
jgi:hypothetical protein